MLHYSKNDSVFEKTMESSFQTRLFVSPTRRHKSIKKSGQHPTFIHLKCAMLTQTSSLQFSKGQEDSQKIQKSILKKFCGFGGRHQGDVALNARRGKLNEFKLEYLRSGEYPYQRGGIFFCD